MPIPDQTPDPTNLKLTEIEGELPVGNGRLAVNPIGPTCWTGEPSGLPLVAVFLKAKHSFPRKVELCAPQNALKMFQSLPRNPNCKHSCGSLPPKHVMS